MSGPGGGALAANPRRELRAALPPPEPEEAGLDIAGFAAALWRARFFGVAGAVAAASAGVIWAFSVTPVYEATARVLVAAPLERMVNIDPVAPAAPRDQTTVESEVEALRSAGVAATAAMRLRLDRDPEFAAPERSAPLSARLAGLVGLGARGGAAEDGLASRERASETVLRRLGAAVDVRRAGASRIVGVTARSADPRKAALIANAYVAAYLDAERTERSDAAHRAVAGIEGELDRLRQRAEASAETLAAARLTLAAAGAPGTEALSRRVTTTAEAAARAGVARAESEARAAAIAARVAANAGIAATWPGETPPTAVLARLRVAEIEASRRVAHLAALYGPEDARTRSAEGQIAELREEASGEHARLIAGAEAEAAAARALEASLRADLRALEQDRAELARELDLIARLEADADADAKLLESFRGRAAEVAAQASLGASAARFTAVAGPPTTPASPRRRLVALVAAALGLIGGLAAGVAFDQTAGRLRNAEEFARVAGARIPARIQLGAPVTAARAVFRAARSDPRSRPAEAARTLLAALSLGRDPAPGVVTVAPAIDDGSGAATALLLALAAAETGRSAAIVDLDFRREGASAVFPATARPGALHLIRDGLDPWDCAAVDQLSELHGFPAVTSPEDVEVLAGPGLAEAVARLREAYDFVVLSAPPVTESADALYIARVSDAVVETAAAELATLGDAALAAQRLAGVGCAPVATVLLEAGGTAAALQRGAAFGGAAGETLRAA